MLKGQNMTGNAKRSSDDSDGPSAHSKRQRTEPTSKVYFLCVYSINVYTPVKLTSNEGNVVQTNCLLKMTTIVIPVMEVNLTNPFPQ